jgi:hypothetical protein
MINTKLNFNYQPKLKTQTTSPTSTEDHVLQIVTSLDNLNGQLLTKDNLTNSNSNLTKNIVYISVNDLDSTTSSNDNQIILCMLQGKNLTNCSPAIYGLFGPENLLVLGNKLYIVTYNNSSIVVCNLNQLGGIINCSNTTLPITEPVNIVYLGQQLYISNFNATKIAACDLDSNGNIIYCDVTQGIAKIYLQSRSANGYFYTPSFYSNSITKCSVSSNNQACSSISSQSISEPLTVEVFNTSAYIINASSSIINCNILTDGDFADCMVVESGMNEQPIGIAMYIPANESANNL